MLTPGVFAGLGMLAAGAYHPLLSLFCCAIAMAFYSRIQRLQYASILWKIWRRFREQKPQLDKRAEQKADQQHRRRNVRAMRSVFTLASGMREQPARVVLAGCFRDNRWFWADVEESRCSPRHDDELDWLHGALWHYPRLRGWRLRRAESIVETVVTHRGVSGRIVDLLQARSEIIRLYVASLMSGVVENGKSPLADLSLSDLSVGIASYRLPDLTLLQDAYEKDQGYFEALLGGQAVLSSGEIPGSVQVQALLRFADEVELSLEDIAELREQDVALGLDRLTGELVPIDISRTFHLLIVGASRWGKSVLLNLLAWQLLMKPKELVARLYLCDLKGVGFQKFVKDRRVMVARTIPDVAAIVRRLVSIELKRRIDFMLKHAIENYPGPRIFVFFDEYAVLQQYAVLKADKPGEARKEQLLADLKLLSQQAAAAGIILVASVQKASASAMDSDFKDNLENVLLFRVHHRATSGATLGPTEDLPADPTRQLGRGECIFRSPGEGADRIVRIFMSEAARDGLANIEAAKAELVAMPDIDVDEDDDNVVSLQAAE
jgi:hypothetical protein